MSWAELFYPKTIHKEDLAHMEATRKAFADCAKVLETVLPEGRYKSIVKTELEKTATLATKAFTHP